MRQVSFEALGAKVTGYLHAAGDVFEGFDRRPAAVVCPGGGYTHLSAREAESAALALLAAGFQAFILEYAVGEISDSFLPMRQLAGTISQVRAHAQDWGVARDKVLAMGFSAGAHLAASLGCLSSFCKAGDEGRPDALCLCYPVVTAGAFAHRPSFDALCGEDAEKRRLFSLERQVPLDLPPCFIWHTADDGTVPVENALLFAAALAEKRVSFELHVFPHGKHGGAMCTHQTGTYNPAAAQWFPCFLRWAGDVFQFPFSGIG